MTRFASKKARRDVSATELAHLLSLPWATRHAECSYAGAPSAQPQPDLVVQPNQPRLATPVDSRVVVGTSGSHRVGLPRECHHLAILGRTQSGKSTLALNLILQILAKQPKATVVVIEPTGRLVEGLVSRLSLGVAAESIEIDPAHATFRQADTTMVLVPLSVLGQPEGNEESDTEREHWAEALAGDLLVAIRNAWGEESIGGRAELVLRALVQGLSRTPGSNLVDAYHLLSSKQALQRFVRSSPPGPLRNFLESHLPRFGYDFTMSSLDKVGKIATNPLLRIALCQRRGSVSFDRLLRHRLLLLNLSKPALGADGANFLGAIYLTQLWAALQRTGTPARPVYLVIDEAHNYATSTLADMLSEGAKYGLHVVVITQYLHRLPLKTRTALVGNADAWLLFSLGAEDMDDAWKIASGEAHGWRQQDLVDGLRPHQVAMALPGTLLKLDTLPSPLLAGRASELKAAVVASSRRYAQPEDSEASPWLIDQDEVEESLRSLSRAPRTRGELVDATHLPPDKLEAALARSASAGDVVRGSEDGKFHLTARGSIHLRALEGRRNEGEEHVETLTELEIFLEARGIALSVPKQVAGVLMPDGQFQWGDAIYNVEVECSTVSKAAGQVVRNVKKARNAGYRVLVVLPEPGQVSRTLAILHDSFPVMRLWVDGVGLVWKDGRASFRPHRIPAVPIWSFLESADGQTDLPEGTDSSGTQPLLAPTDPFPQLVRAAISDLVASGRYQATCTEILEALPESVRGARTDEQVGFVLRSLGCTHERVRADGRRIRVYDLTPVAGPADRKDVGSGHSGADDSDHPRFTPSPMARSGVGPADPNGPAE
jgi:Helicase HerA, central domain/TraM recognition site of TraD and TraG